MPKVIPAIGAAHRTTLNSPTQIGPWGVSWLKLDHFPPVSGNL